MQHLLGQRECVEHLRLADQGADIPGFLGTLGGIGIVDDDFAVGIKAARHDEVAVLGEITGAHVDNQYLTCGKRCGKVGRLGVQLVARKSQLLGGAEKELSVGAVVLCFETAIGCDDAHVIGRLVG